MSIASALGLTSGKKVRYAFVALGDITQEAMLPGVKHTGNSEVVAFVTGDPEKARGVGEQYGVTDSYGYDQFGELLASGKIDAIYLATPNWRHAEFVIPALKAGIHVLVEKPLEVSTERCRQILDAQKTSSAKLMVAYRLHFEPATLATIDLVRSGQLGTLLTFTATFTRPSGSRRRSQRTVSAAGASATGRGVQLRPVPQPRSRRRPRHRAGRVPAGLPALRQLSGRQCQGVAVRDRAQLPPRLARGAG